jgi:hypothetical protein
VPAQAIAMPRSARSRSRQAPARRFRSCRRCCKCPRAAGDARPLLESSRPSHSQDKA